MTGMPISSSVALTCFRWWCRFRDKTAKEQPALRCFSSVKPSAAQDFRGYGMPMADNLAGNSENSQDACSAPQE
jgi:hypothetical protein